MLYHSVQLRMPARAQVGGCVRGAWGRGPDVRETGRVFVHALPLPTWVNRDVPEGWSPHTESDFYTQWTTHPI